MAGSKKRNREAADIIREKPEYPSENPEQLTRGKRRRRTANEDDHGNAVSIHANAIPIREKKGALSRQDRPSERVMDKVAKKHVRFGSNSPAPILKSQEASITTGESQAAQPEESDDDEAPEAISLSHAAAATLAAQKEEAKALKQRESEAREKRKRRAERLTEQSKASTKRKNGGKVEDSKALASDELLDLLPEELLATEAPARPPTPPPPFVIDKNPSPLNVRTVWKDEEEVKPRDYVVNKTKIRVLHTENKLLAPKASNETRKIREAWLRGIQRFQKPGAGTGEISKVRRRAFKQAFV